MLHCYHSLLTHFFPLISVAHIHLVVLDEIFVLECLNFLTETLSFLTHFSLSYLLIIYIVIYSVLVTYTHSSKHTRRGVVGGC